MSDSGSSSLSRALWWVYGHTYDGLLSFWPYKHLIEQVAARAQVKAGEQVLDLGCGTGNLLGLLLEDGVTAEGVDISSTMLQKASTKNERFIESGKLKLVRSDILSFLENQPDETYDVITSINVVYAIANRDQLWREALRVLKPDGRIVMTTSDRPGSWPIIQEHFRNASFASLISFKMLGVFIVDGIINVFGNAGRFPFADESTLRSEVERNGGTWIDPIRTYGGEAKGVNVLVTIKKI